MQGKEGGDILDLSLDDEDARAAGVVSAIALLGLAGFGIYKGGEAIYNHITTPPPVIAPQQSETESWNNAEIRDNGFRLVIDNGER